MFSYSCFSGTDNIKQHNTVDLFREIDPKVCFVTCRHGHSSSKCYIHKAITQVSVLYRNPNTDALTGLCYVIYKKQRRGNRGHGSPKIRQRYRHCYPHPHYCWQQVVTDESVQCCVTYLNSQVNTETMMITNLTSEHSLIYYLLLVQLAECGFQ